MKPDLHKIIVFENGDITKMEPGHITISTEVVESSLNLYGKAHGGYLFTLCDQAAGLVAISLGSYAVTLQSSINYLKPGELGSSLVIDATCSHDGKHTKIVEVTITNETGELLTKATFTMFVTGKVQNR